ncbi:unnamed protein product [Rotaria sp. Silwood2]|nr:unnamed protein product [Rotaria sp. Silwood2]CAF4298079.1 unnamed protein product [Rotaria sp. Silwood2]CAF4314243.1 unnamed protein product [Rotaria sp. Silwood2]CAF4388193.1 unnamed protein product [Rotaria sp. Silwood2]
MNYRRLGGGVGVIKVQQYDSILYGSNSASGSSSTSSDDIQSRSLSKKIILFYYLNRMINSQTGSNDDQLTSSEINNDSLNDNIDNQKEELSSNNNNDYEICKETINIFVMENSVDDVTIKYDVSGGRARGFAFILFDDKEPIEKVLTVTNPVKKIFIEQLPVDFVEQDLSDYFSQFGIIDTTELPMHREKSVCRPFGFISFSSEKTAEEVLRQQRHSINGASIEVRPAKPRPHEQQQIQKHQQ